MSRFLDPGLLQDIANPKPLQVQSPAERMMTGLQLQKMMQDIQTGGMQQQDLQARAAESQAQAQRLALAAQKDQQAGQIAVEYHKAHPDAKPGDPGVQSALEAAGLMDHAQAYGKFSADLAKSQGEADKLTAANKEIADHKADESAYVDQWFQQNPNIPKTPGAVARAKSDFNHIGAPPLFAPAGSTGVPQDPTAQPSGAPPTVYPEKKTFEEKEADSWLAQNPGKTLADYSTFKKEDTGQQQELRAFLARQQSDPALKKYNPDLTGLLQWKSDVGMNKQIIVQSAAANQTSGNGLDLMAEQALNGQFTSKNVALLSKVYSRAAELAKERGMNSTQVLMAQNAAKANRQALDTLTTQSAQVEAFSQTAERNMQTLENAMKAVSDYGAPLLNTPLRSLQSRLGDAKVSAFYASLQPVQTEIAKVLNSSNASGMLTDSARKEMEVALGPGATPQQLKTALDAFRFDIRNRREVYQHQLEDLKGQSVVGGAPAPQAAPSNTFIKPGGALDNLLKQKP